MQSGYDVRLHQTSFIGWGVLQQEEILGVSLSHSKWEYIPKFFIGIHEGDADAHPGKGTPDVWGWTARSDHPGHWFPLETAVPHVKAQQLLL